MSRRRSGLLAARDGAASVEFVLVAPFLIVFVVGMIQLGMLFLANAGMHQAVEAGARFATIYPRPSDTQIRDMVLDNGYGLVDGNVVGPTITHGTTGTTAYADIQLSYSMPLNFIFFEIGPVQLVHTRRAYQV